VTAALELSLITLRQGTMSQTYHQTLILERDLNSPPSWKGLCGMAFGEIRRRNSKLDRHPASIRKDDLQQFVIRFDLDF
jgi:hypothetical protein